MLSETRPTTCVPLPEGPHHGTLLLQQKETASSVVSCVFLTPETDGALHLLLFAVAVLQSDQTTLEEERNGRPSFPTTRPYLTVKRSTLLREAK